MHSLINSVGPKDRVISILDSGPFLVHFRSISGLYSVTLRTLFKEQLQEEINFTERTLQSYYNENPERAVICHNDVHQGNVMRNKDGEIQLDSIILVDFDQAGYGFRMWDIIYFLRMV